jgi:phosphatidylglycerophosphatase A
MLPGLPLQAAVIAAVCLVGIPLSTAASKRFGDLKDPGYVVFDEIASMPITFFGIGLDRWDVVVVGFLLHRLFDITKPPPARQLERLSSGLGIMADDCMAGVYSNLALHAVLWSGILQKAFG